MKRPELTLEDIEKLCASTCRKCEWKSALKNSHYCPYAGGLNEDLSECSHLRKSNYWIQKDRETERATRRAQMIEKGILPKFVLGQIVYEAAGWGGWGERYVKQTIIRRVYPDTEFRFWIYQVEGHNEHIFVDHIRSSYSPIFENPQECQQYIIDNFVQETRNTALRIAKDARRYGMAIGGADIKFLESSKNNEENH